MRYFFIVPFLFGLFISLFIVLAGYVLDFHIYEILGLIPKFCKVEFVCFNGEPNWLGELFLFAPFFFITWLIMSILFLIDIYIKGGWFFHKY
jgi:hypothetical protein